MVKQSTTASLILLTVFTYSVSGGSMPINTYVTSFFDIKRGESLSPRPVEYYYHYFEMLLEIDINLIIFRDSMLKKFVWERRQKHNTHFIETTMEDIRAKWFYGRSEQIRKQRLNWPRFETRNDILFSLKDYNVIMTAKIQCMYDAWRYDPFNSDYLYWIDAGFFHLQRKRSMTPQNLINKLLLIIQPTWINQAYTCCHNRFVGYTNDPSEQYLERTLDDGQQSVIAHIYGGYKELVPDVRSAMVNMVNMHLHNNDMNSDENYWTLMQIRYPYLLPSNFQSFFVMYNNTMSIRQGAFKNQKPHRNVVIKFGQDNGGFILISENTITNFLLKQDQQNIHNTLASKISIQQQRRLGLLRAKIEFEDNILRRRIIQLTLLIITAIYGLIFVRKEEYKILQPINNNQLFQQVSSIEN